MGKNNKYLGLYIGIALIIGFLIGFLIFSGVSNTGNAKAVASANTTIDGSKYLDNMTTTQVDGKTYVSGTLKTGKLCATDPNGKEICSTNVKLLQSTYTDIIGQLSKQPQTDSSFGGNGSINVNKCHCTMVSGNVIIDDGVCACMSSGACAPNYTCRGYHINNNTN